MTKSLILAMLLGLQPASTLRAQEGRLDDASLPRMHAHERVRLGAFDDPVLAFSRIVDLAIGPDNNLYVVQSQQAEITVLDREGRLVRRIGQRGQGPGEFVAPATIGWFADTLWVLDAAQRRVTYFVDSRVTDTHSLGRAQPELERGTYLAAQLPLRGDRVAAVLARELGPGVPPERRHFTILAMRPNGEIVDTLAHLRESYPLRVRIRESSTSPLFHDFPLWRVARDGSFIVVVDRPFPSQREGEVRLTKIAPEGDTLWSRTLVGTAAPLTDRDWRSRVDELFSAIDPTSFTEEEYLSASRRPRFHTLVDRSVLADEGWLWLAMRETHGGQRSWTILDPLGTPRLRLDLPAGFRPYHATANRVWGVLPDSLDVPYVVGYELLTQGQGR